GPLRYPGYAQHRIRDREGIGGTRCPQRVGECTAALPPIICAFGGGPSCHRLRRSRPTPRSPSRCGTVACTIEIVLTRFPCSWEKSSFLPGLQHRSPANVRTHKPC